jgi:putrescine transport system permease protein
VTELVGGLLVRASGDAPDVGAAASLLLLLTLIALALVAVVLRRSGDSSSDMAATLTAG